jgi:hypothetical protein
MHGSRVCGIYRQDENANGDVGRRIYVGKDQANDCPARLLCDTALRAGHDGIEQMEDKVQSVATILERELQPTISEWLRRVNMVPELTRIPLSGADRTRHLPKLFDDVICRLRLAKDAPRPISAAAAAHGQIRREQGYSAAMLVEESWAFEVSTFGTLHLHQSELDQNQMLLDIMVIADEADAQLTEAVGSLLGTKLAQPAAQFSDELAKPSARGTKGTPPGRPQRC